MDTRTLLVLTSIIVINILIYFTWIRRLKRSISVKAKERELLNDIIGISFEGSTLESATTHMIESLQDHYNFSFVSILVYDKERDVFDMKASNTHFQFHKHLSDYAKELYKKQDGPVIIHANGDVLAHKTASERDVRSLYFIPLLVDGTCYGAILLEDKQEGAFNKIHIDFFLLIINNVSFVIRNIFYSETIKQNSETDSLTGLYNRHYMDLRLPAHIKLAEEERTTFSLCVLDIDHFKKFNDKYGHLHGDHVLKTISKFLTERFTEASADAEVYRFGGEEIVIYIKHLSADSAFKVFDNLRVAIEAIEITTKDDKELTPVTISMGVSNYPLNGKTKEELFTKADKALYYSKGHGRNQVTVFDQKCEDVVLPEFVKPKQD